MDDEHTDAHAEELPVDPDFDPNFADRPVPPEDDDGLWPEGIEFPHGRHGEAAQRLRERREAEQAASSG